MRPEEQERNTSTVTSSLVEGNQQPSKQTYPSRPNEPEKSLSGGISSLASAPTELNYSLYFGTGKKTQEPIKVKTSMSNSTDELRGCEQVPNLRTDTTDNNIIAILDSEEELS